MGAHRLERVGQDAAPQTDRGRTCGRLPPAARSSPTGSGGALHLSGSGEARIAYLGGELQDKYARYGWNPRRARAARHRLAPHRSAARAGHRGRAPEDLGDARGMRSHGARAIDGSHRCPTDRNGSRCSPARSARSPDWLLLDEFYNGLDGHYRARIDRVLDAARAPAALWIVAAHRALDVPRRHARGDRARGGAARARSGRCDPPELASTAARCRRASPARAGARSEARAGAPPAAKRPALIRLRQVSLYVDYQSGAARGRLGAAQRRALGGVRRERRGQDQLLEAPLRRPFARAGRQHRARGVSAGNADRRLETPDRLRLAGVADRLRGERDGAGSGRERALRQHRPRRCADALRTRGLPSAG